MAKQPVEVRDRFKVSFETESAAQFGEAAAALARVGIHRMDHELITDVVGFRNNKQHEVGAEEALAVWVKDNPTFRLRDAGKHFESIGRNKSSVNWAAKKLVEAGILKKLDEAGHYARADVAAIEAPKTKPVRVARYAVSNETFILKFGKLHRGRPFTVAQIKAAFAGDGRNASSVSPALKELSDQKLIKRVGKPGSGEYVLTPKGGGVPKPPKKAAPKANGSAEHLAAEAVTNG